MPPLLSDAESDTEIVNGSTKHTESRVEADVEAKDQLKDDLMSDIEETKGKKAAKAERQRVSPTASNAAEDEEDDEEAFEVEEIQGHEWRKKKGKNSPWVCLYNVKWKNYAESDNTLEPEDNLIGSRDILAAYHHKIGGAPQPPSGGEELKKKASRKSLRDADVSATDDSPAPPAKRQKRTESEDDDDGGNDFSSRWQPKGKNWETDIKEIQTVERDEHGDLYILMIFKNGKKSRVKNGLVRQKCPQRLLDFYEKHLNFATPTNLPHHTKA